VLGEERERERESERESALDSKMNLVITAWLAPCHRTPGVPTL